MSKELDKLRQSMMTAADDAARSPVPFSRTNSFFSFRYSCTEISSQGGNLNVKMKETRFQDGKLTSEECEGTLDRGAYDAVVREAQHQFLDQIAGFMKLFYLPFAGGDRRHDE
jgi:hypothetical protein